MYAIVMAAANLKVTAPEQFEQLVEAFRQLEERYKTDLIVADSSVIFGFQGRAWLGSQLRQKLERCLELRNNYEKRS
jgi:hypothetical protein